MLFVPCELDGRFVELFVDSGASTSAISVSMVRHLGLQSKLNRNVAGSAMGAGSAQIRGVIENVACEIGHVEFRMFFMVLGTFKKYIYVVSTGSIPLSPLYRLSVSDFDTGTRSATSIQVYY
jgi:hypothetical protein